MESRSNTTSGSLVSNGTPTLAVDGLVLADLDRRDFARARAIIDGFDRWPSFDDFACERDGLYIGLACAGCEAQLAPVSLRAFESWILHSGMSATVQALDEFAARVHAFRRAPALPVEGLCAVDWKRGDRDIGPRDGCFRIPIAAVLYQEWLGTLSRLDFFTQSASIDIYARMLVEFWVDRT
jgi:hypothetical protein